MNKKYLLLFIPFFFAIVNSVCAQELTVTGTVASSTDGNPIPFATVAVKGTNNAVTTDIDGKYSIQHVSSEDTIMFSFVGYATQKIKVGEQKEISVKLKSSSKELGEVVVTALGVSRQKREIGYSTEKIGGQEIQQSNSPNILNAITGKAAGVQIVNPDGVDGGTTRITIRGNNNISGNNQPLIVVDGIPLSNDPGLTDVGRGRDWGSAINNLNMADVEDINILKGGAASALYGARGANGVVLITTKKGKKQKGIGVSYNMTYKVSHPYRYRDVQNEYGGGAPFSDFTYYQTPNGSDSIRVLPSYDVDPEFGYPGTAISWGPKFDDQNVRWWDTIVRPWSPQPDNLKTPFQNGHTVTHNISVEGGGDIGSLRFSLSRIDNTPIIENSNYNQTSVSTNSNLKVSEKVSLGLTAEYTSYKRLNSPLLGEDPNSIFKGMLYAWPRSYRFEDRQHYELPDGSRDPLSGYPYRDLGNGYIWWNYFNNNTTLDRTKLLGGVSLNYEITNWLTATGRTGIDYTADEYQAKNKPTDLIGLTNGFYSEKHQRDKSYNHEFLFTAKKNNIFNTDINLGFNAGGSQWSRNMSSDSAHSGTWYFPNWYSLSNYTQTTYGVNSAGTDTVTHKGDDIAALVPATNFYKKKINSLYAFLDVSYKNYLFVEFTGRNDWSSTLPSNANSYFYPGISASFIASDALKFKRDWFNFCKIRGGAAQTANDAEPFQTEFYYNTTLFGGQQSSTFPSVIPPAALKPQRVNAYEVGTNLGFFNDRITIDFTYYYKYCFDQIIALGVPTSSGEPNVVINDGVLTNKGFEVILNATVLQKKNFLFKTGLNFTRNKNKVVSLGEINAPYPKADIWGQNGPRMDLYPGDDFGTIVGWDYKYINGQRVVSDDGQRYLISDDRVPVGNASPHFLAGWTTQFQYKNFTLRTLIDSKWGGDIYCGSYVTGLQTGQSPETLLERDGGGLPITNANGSTTNTGVILDGVHEDGTANTTVVPYIYKYLPNDGGWGHFLTKPGIIEDSWVKFREVTLSYNFPAKLVSKTKIFQELSLSITARDLFYIYSSVPDHINPEGTMGAGDAQGFEWASLPGVRSFSFGISARF